MRLSSSALAAHHGSVQTAIWPAGRLPLSDGKMRTMQSPGSSAWDALTAIEQGGCHRSHKWPCCKPGWHAHAVASAPFLQPACTHKHMSLFGFRQSLQVSNLSSCHEFASRQGCKRFQGAGVEF